MGSGPRAACDYPFAVAADVDVIATCNGGLVIEPNPSWLWLTDTLAVKIYMDAARAAIAQGSQLITGMATVARIPEIGRLAAQIMNYDLTQKKDWIPGLLVNGRTSGCFLVQHAVNCGADQVHLVGISGYKSGKGQAVVDHFDGETVGSINGETMDYYGPMLQSVMDQSPGVQFVFYGEPEYPWAGKNVSVVDTGAKPEPIKDQYRAEYDRRQKLIAEVEEKRKNAKPDPLFPRRLDKASFRKLQQ